MNSKEKLQRLLDECRFDLAKLKADLREARKIGYQDDIEDIRENISTLQDQIKDLEKELKRL